jgi:hypothetical protein
VIVDRAGNRARILTLILLATLDDCIAAMIGAAVTGIAIVAWILGNAGDLPDSLDGLKYLATGIGAIIAAAAVIGGAIAVVRIPALRRKLEEQILAESGATMVDPDCAAASAQPARRPRDRGGAPRPSGPRARYRRDLDVAQSCITHTRAREARG